MALRTFCNGCGREVSDGPENRHDDELGTERFHLVEVRRAQIAGTSQPLGLAGEPTTRGELCDSCWTILVEFVGDVVTSQETLAALPRARALATA